MTNVSWRELGATFVDLAAEIKRRQESASDDQAPIYLFIYDVQRFRDLRKADDDFGYSRYDEDKPAAAVQALRRCAARRTPRGYPHNGLVRQRE